MFYGDGGGVGGRGGVGGGLKQTMSVNIIIMLRITQKKTNSYFHWGPYVECKCTLSLWFLSHEI